MTFSPTRISRWLAPLCLVLGALLLVSNIAIWNVPTLGEYTARRISGIGVDVPVTLGSGPLLFAMLATSLHLLLLAYALFHLSRVFRVFTAGTWFVPAVSEGLIRFGFALGLYGALSPLMRTLVTLAITYRNGEGDRLLAIGFTGNDLVLAMVGTLIVILGYIMREATTIADDNRQIV
ncbi:MAG: hypothetical protein KDH88_03015 [Chromatiales bacterium]|nr:hypothetical protein [Chromatiales bacterium]